MAGTEKSILKKLTKPLLFLSNFSIFLLFFFFFFFFSFTIFAAPTTPHHHALLNLDNINNNNIIKLKPQTVNALFYHHQVLMKMEEWVSSFSMQQQGRYWSLRRRLLSSDQPGSWPPLCISKCDQCTPCQPVHVSVPPGRPVTTEYYPVAWRCKCGNKLYMP